MDWQSIISAAHDATDKYGIPMRGRKYLQVQHRVEMFRLHFGDYGVETTLLHYGQTKGDSIVVQAIIKNPEGRVVASGIAEEIRGQGAVNTTSAIENAETSAIGRALACLGLHGGEFASLNEVERALDPDVAKNAEGAQKPKTEPFNEAETRDKIKSAIANAPNVQKLDALWNHPKTVEAFGKLHPAMQGELTKCYSDRTAAVCQAPPDDEAA